MIFGIKKGDKITFRASTRWAGAPLITRTVNGHWDLEDSDRARPTVRYGGWSRFLVRPGEIELVNGVSVQAEDEAEAHCHYECDPRDAL